MTKEHPDDDKKKRFAVVGVLIVVIFAAFVLFFLQSPRRSAAAYCQVYKEEKARLAKLPGDTWPSGVFNDAVSDAGEFATAFSRLEKVAPNEIRPDVATLQSIYQKIHDDPSQGISASLSGVSAESSVEEWTKENCQE